MRAPALWRLHVMLVSGALMCWAPGAEARDDWQLWLEQKWSVKLTDSVRLVGKTEERFRDDLGEYYVQIAAAGISWKPLSWLKVEPGYQYQWTEKTNHDTTIENRGYLSLIPAVSWGPFHMEDRNRIEFRHINGRDDWRYRNKAKLSLEAGRGWYAVEPFVADEVFYGARAGEWDRNRIFIGVGKALHRVLDVELFYLIESNKQGRDWDEFHVLGVTTSVGF